MNFEIHLDELFLALKFGHISIATKIAGKEKKLWDKKKLYINSTDQCSNVINCVSQLRRSIFEYII